MARRIHVYTNEQIQNCVHSHVQVEVWVNGQLDTVGLIEYFTTGEPLG